MGYVIQQRSGDRFGVERAQKLLVILVQRNALPVRALFDQAADAGYEIQIQKRRRPACPTAL